MAKLDEKKVRRVANLAHLPLAETEVDKLEEQLSDVLNHFEELEDAKTDKLDLTAQTSPLDNNLREDEIKQVRQLSQEEALSNAENTHNGYFVVEALLSKN